MAASGEGEMATLALFVVDLLCIVPSVVLKVPQLQALYVAKSTKGISFSSVVLELISQTIFVVYMFATDAVLTQYVEYLFLIVQMWILILMMLHYSNQMDIRIIIYSTLYFGATGIVGGGLAPKWVAPLLLTLSTPISASGMVLQIVAIFKIKSSGSVSFLSWFIAFATGFLRLITSIIAGDLLVVASYTVSTSLRVVGCATILYYRPQAKKFE